MLGKVLRGLRNRQENLSQDALAEKIGVTQQTVAAWEKDSNDPKLDKLIRLADFFGVTLDYLAGRSSNPGVEYRLYTEEVHLVESYRDMDAVSKSFLMRIVDCLRATPASQIKGNLNIQHQTKNSIIAAGDVNMQNTTNS